MVNYHPPDFNAHNFCTNSLLLEWLSQLDSKFEFSSSNHVTCSFCTLCSKSKTHLWKYSYMFSDCVLCTVSFLEKISNPALYQVCCYCCKPIWMVTLKPVVCDLVSHTVNIYFFNTSSVSMMSVHRQWKTSLSVDFPGTPNLNW